MICVVEASLAHAPRRLFNSVEELRGAVRSKEARLLGANSNVSLQARKSGFNPTWPNFHQDSVFQSFNFLFGGRTCQGLIKINNANDMTISCQDCVTLADNVHIGLVSANPKDRKTP